MEVCEEHRPAMAVVLTTLTAGVAAGKVLEGEPSSTSVCACDVLHGCSLGGISCVLHCVTFQSDNGDNGRHYNIHGDAH